MRNVSNFKRSKSHISKILEFLPIEIWNDFWQFEVILDCFAFRFYYEVGEKYTISCQINFCLSFLNEKSQSHGIISISQSRSWKDVCIHVCMYVYVCERCLEVNFYPIATKCVTQVGPSLKTSCWIPQEPLGDTTEKSKFE